MDKAKASPKKQSGPRDKNADHCHGGMGGSCSYDTASYPSVIPDITKTGSKTGDPRG